MTEADTCFAMVTLAMSNETAPAGRRNVNAKEQ